MSESITIIHLSDLHFVSELSLFRGLLDHQRLISKRHLGWLNHKLRRQKHFDASLKERIFDYLHESQWDYLIITGDLGTLTLPREYDSARQSLDPLNQKGKILLTSGNHDRYVKTSPEPGLFSRSFKDYWPYSESVSEDFRHCFYELSDSAILVELDMAIPRIFYSSRGRLNEGISAIEKILKNEYKDHLKIAIGHYPAFLPPGEREGFLHSLSGRDRLKRFLLDMDFRFYLHGHIHKSWMFNPVTDKQLTIINSGGCCKYADGEWSGFHKITLTGKAADVERINC